MCSNTSTAYCAYCQHLNCLFYTNTVVLQGVNVLTELQKKFQLLVSKTVCQPNKSSIDIGIIDAVSFWWVDSNGLEEHAASNFTCEELKHIINDSSLYYKISTYTKYPHYRLKKEGGDQHKTQKWRLYNDDFKS